MSASDQVKPYKSLQELAASKTIDELLKLTNPTAGFFRFHEHQQELVFKQLFNDYAHLIEEKKRYEINEELTPQLDWLLYTRRHDRIESPGEEKEVVAVAEEDGDGDEDHGEDSLGDKALRSDETKPTNGYLLGDKFFQQWRYFTESEMVDDISGRIYCQDQQRENRFHNDSLCSHGLEADLVVCKDWPPPCRHGAHNHLYDKISSQLLCYRVTTIFGMPPQSQCDGYKSCWEAKLVYKDWEGTLTVADYKGSVTAHFYGKKEARESALALLNFLTGLNCPHTYDGVVAGTAA